MLSEDKLTTSVVGCEMKMVPSERLCFLGPDYCWNRFARVSSSIENSACFCYCINHKEMSCHESKISFLSCSIS